MQNNLGGLWRGVMKDKSVYFHGEIEVVAGIKTRIVIFPNKPREGQKLHPKAPAYKIYLSKPNPNELKIEEIKVLD